MNWREFPVFIAPHAPLQLTGTWRTEKPRIHPQFLLVTLPKRTSDTLPSTHCNGPRTRRTKGHGSVDVDHMSPHWPPTITAIGVLLFCTRGFWEWKTLPATVEELLSGVANRLLDIERLFLVAQRVMGTRTTHSPRTSIYS